MDKAISIFLLIIGPFVIGLNLATMYPNTYYEASWHKVGVAGLMVLCGVLINLVRTQEK